MHQPLVAALILARALGLRVDEGAHAVGKAGEQRPPPRGRELVELRGQQLRREPEGDVALELCARSPQHAEAEPAGRVQGGFVEARLADPGVALDQQRLTVAAARALERVLDRREQTVALEQPGSSPLGAATAICSLEQRHSRH